MASRQQLQQLFQYDLWSARKLADALLTGEEFEEKPACFAFLSHIVNIQQQWFHRVVVTNTELKDVWYEYEPRILKKRARESSQLWIDLIGDHEVDLKARILHKRQDGHETAISIENVCKHLIVHGQYHRAQVSLMLSKSGMEVPKTDFVHFSRGTEIRTYYS